MTNDELRNFFAGATCCNSAFFAIFGLLIGFLSLRASLYKIDLDLYKERMEIYTWTTNSMMDIVVNFSTTGKLEPEDIRQKMHVTKEIMYKAFFVLPDELRDDTCNLLLSIIGYYEEYTNPNKDLEKMRATMTLCIENTVTLPKRFMLVLDFRDLSLRFSIKKRLLKYRSIVKKMFKSRDNNSSNNSS